MHNPKAKSKDINMEDSAKISKNRQKKIEIVAGLNEKLASSKALVFTNYQGLTHKQLEGLKKEIKPLKAEFVIAKNSLVLRALDENKIKIEDEKQFEGPTGTLIIYEDIAGPLKALAKLIKELGIPNVKFGILDDKTLSGEQVLKISSLPSRDVLLSQIAMGLKSPILSLHRALNWNLQKLVITLNAVAQSKPAIVADAPVADPTPEPVAQETPAETTIEPVTESALPSEPPVVSEAEPETILAETQEELKAEETVAEKAAEESVEKVEALVEEVKEESKEVN